MTKQYLARLGISALNEMQLAAIKAASENKNILLLSPTGSGKTLAYLLSLLPYLDPTQKGVQAMIIVPSRELALQIEQVLKSMQTGFKVNTFYGGHAFKTEVNNMKEAPSVVIGTPGRILDHFAKGSMKGYGIRHLILDEFDKSLEMGFGGEMSNILLQLTQLETRFLTSATQAVKIPEFVKAGDPYVLDFTEKYERKESRLSERMVVAEGSDKLEALFKLICLLSKGKMLVFCNHRDAVDRISELLSQRNVPHGTYHGKHEQDEREKILVQFRNESIKILLATDLAARGLDISAIENIIHYQMPQTEEAYVHRNGRTARMHASGSSYLVLSQSESPPKYLKKRPQKIELPENLALPEISKWATMEFLGGKKDKINKVDIAGLLYKKGLLTKEEIGVIEVNDKVSYAAVLREKAFQLSIKLGGEKIKGIKLRISIL